MTGFRKDHVPDTAGKRSPKVGWVYTQSLARTRALTLFLLFLFLLAMPIALLIIGKHNYLAMAATPTFNSSLSLWDHLNPVLFPLHIIIAILSLVAVLVLSSAHFRYLYQQNAVDIETSMPFNSNRQFAGRALALLTSLLFIYIASAAATGIVFASWGIFSHFSSYLSLYVKMFASTIQLSAFSLVLLVLSGTLFDAVLLNVGIQITWIVSMIHILGITDRLNESPTDALWLLTPSAGLFTTMLWPLPIWQPLVLIVFWTTMAWLFFRNRPAERAGVRNGRLSWYLAVQPLFALFGGVTLARFLHELFATNDAFLQSPVFYIGLVLGALLGQFVSSVVAGKPLHKRTQESSTGAQLRAPILRELMMSVLGIVLFAIITAIVWVSITPDIVIW